MLGSLCKAYGYEFDMYKKLDPKFYRRILAKIPYNMTEGIGPKPEQWDITVLIDLYYEKKEEIFLNDLVFSATPEFPTLFEKKKMNKKFGETKACLARLRHLRNKLAHEIRSQPRVKASKAYNAAEAAWSFFKQIDDEEACAFESKQNRNEKYQQLRLNALCLINLEEITVARRKNQKDII